MRKCREIWESITDFLINKLGGITTEAHEAALLHERQTIHYDKRPVHTADICAEAKWQGKGIGKYEREYVAKEIGLRLLAEGFIHFDVYPLKDRELYPTSVTCVRAVVCAVKPTSQGFGYEADGLFIDDPLVHVSK